MNGLENIFAWLHTHVKMHEKRRRTLGHLVVSAMLLRGMGVLALGRAMKTDTSPKHAIKRVWRFLRNDKVEHEAVQRALFEQFIPVEGPIVILVDWTDLYPHTQLVFALPRDGRALPFLSITIAKEGGVGSRIASETQALERLAAWIPEGREVVVVADRGFGNRRWMEGVDARGWFFVVRLSRNFNVDTEGYMGNLHEMRFRPRQRPRDYGWGFIGEQAEVEGRLVVQYSRGYAEPWFLATNLKDAFSTVIVRYYQRRMWIEAMFRDWKNRQWGMGLDAVRLSQADRHDRLFIVLALAYIFLCACGAFAEHTGLAQALKANTRKDRVMTLLRMGRQLLDRQLCKPKRAFQALKALPT